MDTRIIGRAVTLSLSQTSLNEEVTKSHFCVVLHVGYSMLPVKHPVPVPLTPSFNISAYSSRHSV